MIYAELATVAAIVVYIVGVSGFTDSWRDWLERKALPPGKHLGHVRPFDCPACMTWWTCLAYALITHRLTLWTVAASAALSLLSIPMQELMLLLREGITFLARKITDLFA